MFKAWCTVRFVFFLLCSFLQCLGNNAQAEDSLSDWQILQKSAVAAHALSYEGIFVCQSGNQPKSVQIKHLFDGQQEYTRNIMLDGAPRELLSQNGDLVIYNPTNEKIVIEKRRGQNLFPAILPTNIESIKANYTLKMGNAERVAGRAVQVLQLEPKDQFRNRHQFWIDAEYGLILKSVTLNTTNQPIDSIAFNQINLFNTVDLDWFKPKIDTNKNYVMEENVTLSDSSNSPHWQLTALPAGFRKVDQRVLTVQGKSIPVTHLVFSDGLASVSLFIEPVRRGVKARTSAAMRGNTSVYARVTGFLQITALGEVPEVTTAHIANAVIFVK